MHIVRDGRDVALSGYLMHFGAKNAYVAAKQWKQGLGQVEAFAARMPASRFIQFRYEDLLTDPLPVMQALMEFLRIQDPQGELADYLQDHLGADIKKANFYKWKQKFSETEQRIFEQEAGQYLTMYTYPKEFDALPKAGRLKKLYWEVDNQVKKSMRKDYCLDNFYKLNLKIKEIKN